MRSLRAIAGAWTLRGKALLAVGFGLAAGAIVSGQRDLLTVALLVLALPVVSLVVVFRSGFTLGCSRTLSDHHVAVSEPFEVDLTLENLGRRRTATMPVREAIPSALGTPVQRIVTPLRPGDQRRITYTLTPTARGRYRIGPLTVVGVDPFGLVRLRRSFRSSETVLVTPRVVSLTAGSPHAEHVGQGDAALAALAARGDDDVVPREYRIGDDLRRIHWRASARTGDMMVRREELPWTRQATLVIDDRRDAHLGSGVEGSFELALSAIASIGVHLLRHGFSVDIVGLDGVPLIARCTGREGESLLLDALALAELRDQAPDSPGNPWHGDLVIAVALATVDLGIRMGVQAPRRSGDLGIVLLLDPLDFGESESDHDEARRLLQAGAWTTAALPRRRTSQPSAIPQSWAQALADVTTDAGARR